MGMTFDEALDHLYTYSSTLGSGQTTQAQHEEAKRVAIDVMRKYQKLERVFDKTIAEIEQVKSIMNDEIINHNRKDLINFINGLNQSLMVFDKYRRESEE